MRRMVEALDTLPDDVDALKSLVVEQQAALNRQEHKLVHQSQFIEQLLEQIKLGRHRQFGASSERYSLRQLQLLFNEAEAAASSAEAQSHDDASGDIPDTDDTVTVVPHQRAKGGRRPLPPALPRVEIIHELDDDACQCEQCNASLEVIGEKVSEQLDLIPARVRVLRHVRRTYRCPSCVGQLKTAPRPAQPIPKSNASPGTLAQVAVAKYVDALPLYRQEQQLKRIGVDLPRATLANWMVRAGAMVQPLINLLRERMLEYPVLAMDETRLQVLKEPGRSAQSQSYLWVQRGGPPDRPIVLFDYDASRAQSVPIRLLGEYTGYLQTDGYEGYAKVCADNGITALGCWAHARRKFDEALKAQGKGRKSKDKTSLAAQALKQIQALYQIERKAKHRSADERLAIRQAQSQPVLDALHAWLQTHQPLVPPQSALGKAMTYLDNQWGKLLVYATDGRLAIDNNATENAIRPFVIGRKNFLFCDTVAGALASANLYSLIETAKANGIEPYAYLKTVFTKLPNATTVEDIEALLPLSAQLENRAAA
jgi:transposase